MIGARREGCGNTAVSLIRRDELFESDRFADDQCDECGILVGQELSAELDRQEHRAAGRLEDHSRRVCCEIRRHPSLALYVFGNEFTRLRRGSPQWQGRCERDHRGQR